MKISKRLLSFRATANCNCCVPLHLILTDSRLSFLNFNNLHFAEHKATRTLSFDDHVNNVCKAAYFHIRALRHIRWCVTVNDATIDRCNCDGVISAGLL